MLVVVVAAFFCLVVAVVVVAFFAIYFSRGMGWTAAATSLGGDLTVAAVFLRALWVLAAVVGIVW